MKKFIVFYLLFLMVLLPILFTGNEDLLKWESFVILLPFLLVTGIPILLILYILGELLSR
ncbi:MULTISPECIES: hypothetical protein [Bacillus cereus group]|uniref:DUF4017 domain-containing protein n=1 Tax=Bacillus paramycoides TaxID=2026194 RepID=A0ABU6N4F9_9BACI|nr:MULTISPECIES: hypothetical protein [Bacillus cereus group]MED1569749.1 hypothetical protein [Bacillus paramycoides]